jgi:organic hydroperoxide reductase OsmC/OhrA
VTAWWAESQNGIAKSDSAPNAIHFAAPPQFGGTKGRWSPEELLLSSLASCFTTTFNTLAEYSRLPYLDLEVEGMVSKGTDGYRFAKVLISPSLTIIKGTEQERALQLLNKIKTLCLISRALNIP